MHLVLSLYKIKRAVGIIYITSISISGGTYAVYPCSYQYFLTIDSAMGKAGIYYINENDYVQMIMRGMSTKL